MNANLPILLSFLHSTFTKFSTQIQWYQNLQTCKEKMIQNQNREEWNVAPFPSKIPFKITKIQKQLPYVPIWTNCQSTYLSSSTLPICLIPSGPPIPLALPHPPFTSDFVFKILAMQKRINTIEPKHLFLVKNLCHIL